MGFGDRIKIKRHYWALYIVLLNESRFITIVINLTKLQIKYKSTISIHINYT
jgi:hypothetical protein